MALCPQVQRAGHLCKGAGVSRGLSEGAISQVQVHVTKPRLIPQKIQGPATQTEETHPASDFDLSSYTVQKRIALLICVTALRRS